MAFFPKKQGGPSELAWDVRACTRGELTTTLKMLTDGAYRVFAIIPITSDAFDIVSYVNVAYAKKLAKQKKKKPAKRAKAIAEDAAPLGGG